MQITKLYEILSSYNRFWSTGSIEAGIDRDILPACLRQLDSREIIVFKGVRRCGKSTLMAQVIRALLTRGVKPAAILRVNLEEPLFSAEYSIELLEQIYRAYRERVQPEGKCWLFMDEVQNVPGWESWVRGRSETEDIKIFVTGSSSQMLSRGIGTKLTGRNISFEVFPLSFSEFLRFNNLEIDTELDYMTKKATVRNLFNDYLKYGGFPEVVLKESTEDKELLLKSYFEDLLYRDIVSRYEIRDVANLRNLAVYLLTNVAKQTSTNKLKNNFTISQDKTENYVSAIMESYLLFQLLKFSYSLKSTMRAGFKPYAIDTGLRNRIAFAFSEDMGWLVENVVMCHLKRQHEEVYYDSNSTETDFIVKEGMKITRQIQVWYEDLSETTIPERELACFRKTLVGYQGAETILVTNDYEDVIDTGMAKVQCIPVSKFLLFGA
ncbi:MAG: ATPase [Geobacteraceae bacterium GWC2_58_44]|nr:MAG: ATPase [Geobacteraceae bacterium GWC2_58_44]HBG06749.1 ATPase [Geobacter sp.]